ncbi:MAG: hypothetical protein CL670_17265 [Balneola sp.]|jgi:hypothetical protein|nr:hypothetical protein [Balneola sp.]MBE80146.1 hypothetical protein [Balneola sp.]MBE80912.1 hypothetical protein [Balneola sp.]|tara:strand:- start:555 stop:1793 length:1239 start_codon:yes stop_codon:yes gene_type:complete
MKSQAKYITVFLLALVLGTSAAMAQQKSLQYFKDPGKSGLNVFETPKTTNVEFDGLYVRVGGDFALQFQGISQSNAGDSLAELGNNFNLPTANLNLDVQLDEGLRMHLRTYLSSRHHTESYVKGGYMQIDRLDFIEEGFMDGLMDVLTIRVGMDQINYGDAHFRRSDNAAALYNPFVGNYIMDNFTTEPFMELTYQNSGIIGVIGATNGRLNQSVTSTDDGIVLFGKLGYDKQLNEDLRFRLTGSFYNSSEESTRDYIYGGDRAGGRYYAVMEGGDFSGRFNPGFGSQTAFQINPFVKFQGLEFFGIFEQTSNSADAGGSFTQLGGEVIYRFGADEDIYLGGRYNMISGERTDAAATQEISRINFGGGWFMTDNVLTKLEYVSQSYDGDGWNTSLYNGGEFSGIMLEAVISF